MRYIMQTEVTNIRLRVPIFIKRDFILLGMSFVYPPIFSFLRRLFHLIPLSSN